MKNTNWYKWLSFALILVLVYVLFKDAACAPDPTHVTVKTPEVKGTLRDTANTPIVHVPIPAINTVVVVERDTVPVVDSIEVGILQRYLAAGNDSIKKLNVLLDAIRLQRFYKDIENDDLSLCLSGTVRGELKNIEADYVIKSRSLSVPVPQPWLTVLAGGELGANAKLKEPVFKVNLDFRIKSGDQFGAGADNAGHYYIRYSKPIFKFGK